jgi:DNA-binding transcriptional ArsR family regulator
VIEPRSSPYAPRKLSPARLEALTVGRAPLLRHLQDSIAGSVALGQARFDLLIGPRGSGKSHLLGALEHRLRGSAQLAERTLVVAPPEHLHPTSLVQLLALLLREFPDDPDAGPVAPALESLRRQADGDQERRAVALIRARLAGRTMIIVLEHLDDLFDALGRAGQQRLRNILQTERSWSILAGARALLPAFTKHEAPFHGTFNIHRLEPLSAALCRDMLVALAHAHAREALAAELGSSLGLARVRGLRHIVGGTPRAMALIYEQLDAQCRDDLGREPSLELALTQLAEQQTPYLQEQLNRLSPAQRNIMELLAEHWRPLSVGEIAEHTFTTHGSTSGSIRHLRADRLVEQIELGRERLYELADPLHRIAWAGERKQQQLDAFAGVVREWFSAVDVPTPMLAAYPLPGPPDHRNWTAQDVGAPAALSSVPLAKPPQLQAIIERALEGADREAELVRAIDLAWHHRALEPVRLSSLNPTSMLPGTSGTRSMGEPTRRVLLRAWCCSVFDHASTLAEPATAQVRDAAALIPVLMQDAGSTTSQGFEPRPATSNLLACLTLHLLTSGLVSGDSEIGIEPSHQFGVTMRLGMYAWLAARRPLAPLARLAARLHEQRGVDPFGLELFRCKSTRHAVAHLAGPERELVRQRLIHLQDVEGLAYFGFDPEPE